MHTRGADFLGDFACGRTKEVRGENTQQTVTGPPAPVLWVPRASLETNRNPWDTLAPELWYCITTGLGNQLSAGKLLICIYGSI